MKAALLLSLIAITLSSYTYSPNKSLYTGGEIEYYFSVFNIPSGQVITQIDVNWKASGSSIGTLVAEIGLSTQSDPWWTQAGTKSDYYGSTGTMTWTFTESDAIKYTDDGHIKAAVYWTDNAPVILSSIVVTTVQGSSSSSSSDSSSSGSSSSDSSSSGSSSSDSSSSSSGSSSSSSSSSSGSSTGKCSAFANFPDAQAICEKYAADYSSKFKSIFSDGPIYSGDGTDYGDGNGGGNCLFPKAEYYADKMYAAINNAQYNTDYGCGLCALVVTDESPKNAIRVRMIDQCPECAKGSLDFSDTAWKALTNISPGRIKITWTVIPCDIAVGSYPALVTSSKVKFKFKSGSTQYWWEVQVFNTKYPVAKVEVKNGSSYSTLTHKDYNYWGGVTATPPFTFRVTLADSTVITATGVTIAVPSEDEGTTTMTGTQTVS